MIDEMSLFQFGAVVAGWNKAHGEDGMPEPPSAAEFHDMVRRLA